MKAILILITRSFWSLLLWSLIFQPSIFAQTQVTLLIEDTQKIALVGVSIRLTEVQNPVRNQNGVTDAQGIFKAALKANTPYRLQASFVGYQTLSETFELKPNENRRIFILKEDASSLGEVTVTAKKPLVSQVDDMSVVDPTPIVDMSANAMEVMEKVPGLFIDQDGNIYLSSTTPATVYINGRDQKMSASDMANLLKNIPPASIDRIEILRNPSAKFDASGSGGVVNVVLKKGFKIGLTGSANSYLSMGQYPDGRVGFNLNNSDGGRTSYVNLNLGRRNGFDETETKRQFTADSLLAQVATTLSPSNDLFLRFGFGFEPKPKWELAFDNRLTLNLQSSEVENQNQISRLSDAKIFSNTLNTTQNSTNNLFLSPELSAKYKIDEQGSEWTAELDYSFTSNNGDQDYQNIYSLPFSFTTRGDGISDNQRHAFTAQSDLKLKTKLELTLEAGLKTAFQQFESNAEYFKTSGANRVTDTFRTRRFAYNDQISAAYLQLSKTFGSFVLKSGLRLEHTRIEGHQKIPTDTTFKVNRNDLFPYVYLSRKLISIANFELRGFAIYRRSISRPAYNFLNPSPRYLDQYAYEVGNPNLRPQFTTNYELNISVGDMPIFALGRSDTQDIFTNVVYQDVKNPSIAVRTYDNLGKRSEDYFRLTGAIPPGGRYFFVLGTQYGRNRYDGLYENKPLSFDRGSWSFFTFHSFKIDKFSTLTMNGFLRVKGQQQFYELDNFGAVNLGVNRKFLRDKLTISLNANDIFLTTGNRFSLNQGSVKATGFRKGDSRRIGLNLRYNFGVRKKEERGNMFDTEATES